MWPQPATISAGARTAYRGFYSMLTVGVGDVQEDQLDTVFLGWHYGHAFTLSRTWNLDADLGYEHILPQPSDEPEVNDRLHFAVQARVLAEVRLSPLIRLFGGTGLNATFSEYSSFPVVRAAAPTVVRIGLANSSPEAE